MTAIAPVPPRYWEPGYVKPRLVWSWKHEAWLGPEPIPGGIRVGYQWREGQWFMMFVNWLWRPPRQHKL